MNENLFRKLIGQKESETLDFKESGYDLSDKRGRNAFIKDLLAMANTPRDQSAHIIFGVRWTPEEESTVVGLERQLDDAELQRALGNRVQPNPRFIYTPLRFDRKQVGILEILVETGGPYTPVVDSDSLQAGAVYYRRGTENNRALANDLRRITDWFKGRNSVAEEHDMTSWRQFFEAVHRLDSTRTYILGVDQISPQSAQEIRSLGALPWRAVIDFDPDSDVSGLLNATTPYLRRHRVIHRVVRGDYRVHPEPGTHWFFAQGLTGLQDTLVDSSHKTWLKAYKRELGKQLTRLASTILPSPVVAIVLWSDTSRKNHLRTLIEELFVSFGDAIDVVVVSTDKPSFSELVEEAGATFVSIKVRDLCSGLAVHNADLQNITEERCVLPTNSGAQIEVGLDDWLWLKEDLELVHRSIGSTGDDSPREYRLGADISWRNLHLSHDCERDITPALRSQVEADLKRRQTVRINLYHEPGGGGTTVGHHIAWDLRNTFPVGILRNCRPRETAERISKVASLTGSSVLIVADSGQHSERDIDDLYELVKANQTPTVILQILRRFHVQTPGRRQFWLEAKLTDMEADRFRDAYANAMPHKQAYLIDLARQRNSAHRNAFHFGLTAFGTNFHGLHPYVSDRTIQLKDEQQRILIYISMAHYYGQQSISTQAFATLLKIPRSKSINLNAAFTDDSKPALDLLKCNRQGEWRTSHHLVAREILQQFLAPMGSQNPEPVWRQNLSSWAKDFASFCRGDEDTTSDHFLELVRRVFIYRDNVEVLGTERAARGQFSQLIDNIPSTYGKRDVLNHLIVEFPQEAHFHAHLGRFLSRNEEYDKALSCLDEAISLQPYDPVLHHMRGMVLRERIRSTQQEKSSADQVIRIAEDASKSFEEARQLSPDDEHGYISEVQMLIDLMDKISRGQHEVVRNVLARSTANPFVQQALERAEDLLDRVRHLHAGEQPSPFADHCRARMEVIYGDYSSALQAWDNLLSRPEVAKPPVRRQIVWTILRRCGGSWDRLSTKEAYRIRRLLEDNLEEQVNDSRSLRLWLRAIRQSPLPPSLDSIIEKVGYWKANTGSLDAAYYLYVLHMLHALSGSLQGLADAERALEECRSLAQFRRDRTRSVEWIGPGSGVNALVHQSRLGEWSADFWESPDALVRLQGRIREIGGPQRGKIELECGLRAFFVPGKSGFSSGRDESTPVNFYLGFSYDGPRAWDVRRKEAAIIEKM